MRSRPPFCLVVGDDGARRCRPCRTPRAPPPGRRRGPCPPPPAPRRSCTAGSWRGRSARTPRRPWAGARSADRWPGSTATPRSPCDAWSMVSHSSGCAAKPSLAKRTAAAATSPKLIVPQRCSAWIQASGAAGTTVRKRPRGILPPWRFMKVVGRHQLRPDAEAADREDLAALGMVEDDRRHARDVDDVALQHAERDARGHPGVDGVAARLQNLKPGMRRQVVARGDDVPPAADHRPVGADAARLLGSRRCLAHRCVLGCSGLPLGAPRTPVRSPCAAACP